MSESINSENEKIGALYQEHHPMLRGWLRQKLGCSEQASDLLHDAFIRLLKNGSALKLQEPKAYLMTVAKRVLIDHWRRQQIERAYLDALAHLPEQHGIDVAEQHLMLETLIRIDEMLDGLPVIVKKAFLHYQLDGLKQAEIAERLDVSLSSVKRYLVMAATQCFYALDE